MFGRTAGALEHISLGDEAEVLVVAPATADYIARCACGRASDLISAVTLAFARPVVFAPAMNSNMWRNPATQRNVNTLVELHGWHMVSPEEGELACGWTGTGRMAEPADIATAVAALFAQRLCGKKIVITTGPTVEDIDPVRCITNRSSGRMGCAIARAAILQGAKTVLIKGPCAAEAPPGATFIPVRSALDMQRAVMTESEDADAVVMVAAVADWRPEQVAGEKLKKDGSDALTLRLVPNPDILAELGQKSTASNGPLLVGFALETENLIASAREKLARKKIHMIVANRAADALEKNTTAAVIIEDSGLETDSGPMTKDALAAMLVERIAARLTP
jgi:phosphopantothenoylcysteine decarboxylase/phosphopantothenate--cysteine ligase